MSYVQDKFRYFNEWRPKVFYEKIKVESLLDMYNVDNCGPDTLYTVITFLRDGAIRVKKLDRNDLRELGFTRKKLPHQYWSENEIWMIVDRGGNNYTISRPNLDEEPSFYGVIQNKSELKRILKQLGI
jgi:hypothetical protein